MTLFLFTDCLISFTAIEMEVPSVDERSISMTELTTTPSPTANKQREETSNGEEIR